MQYCYQIKTVDGTGVETVFTGTVCGTTEAVIPPTPTGLTAVGAAGPKVVLTWNASAGTAVYRIYRDGELALSATGVTVTDTTVVGQTGYCYAVSAVNVTGNESARSAQFCTATP